MTSLPILVIGGGISGLSCAHYLTKLPHHVLRSSQVIVLESAKETGGWLQSRRYGDGVIHELGPRSVRTASVVGLNSLNLLEEFGLESEAIGVSSSAHKRFIYINKNLVKLPSGLRDLFVVKRPFSKSFGRLGIEEIMKRKFSISDDISVYDFIKERLGDQAACYLGDPLCRGITAGDARKLSLKSLFPDIFKRTTEKGSLIKGMMFASKPNLLPQISPVENSFSNKMRQYVSWSLKDGLQRLPEVMTTHLKVKDVAIETSSPVKEIRKKDGELEVETKSGKSIKCRAIFSTLPANSLLPCLQNSFPTEKCNFLVEIPFVDVVVVCLEFPEKRNLDGFGFLVPSTEDCKVLGVTYDSSCFPDHDGSKNITRVTCMMGGEWFPQLFKFSSEEEMLADAVKSVRKILGFTTDPVRTTLRVHRQCIPQYRLGHADRFQNFKEELTKVFPQLYLLGTSFHGVGVNDVIFAARKSVYDFSLKETE